MYVLTDQIGVIVHPICFLALTGDQGDMMLCVCKCVCVLDVMLRMALKEFLQHSKESRGVLGQAGKQARKQVSKYASK